MFARTLAAFLIGLVVTVASALTFEAKPPIEQFTAPPAPAPVAKAISPRIEVVQGRPKIPVRTALLPIKIVHGSVTPQPVQPQIQIVSPQIVPPQIIPPQPVPPHVVELAPGTNFLVHLTEALSAKDRYEGDTFRATLARPLIKDGFILADQGSKVLGRIVSAQKHNLALTLTEINTTDGQRVPIKTDVLTSGPTLMFQLTDAITLTEKLSN